MSFTRDYGVLEGPDIYIPATKESMGSNYALLKDISHLTERLRSDMFSQEHLTYELRISKEELLSGIKQRLSEIGRRAMSMISSTFLAVKNKLTAIYANLFGKVKEITTGIKPDSKVVLKTTPYQTVVSVMNSAQGIAKVLTTIVENVPVDADDATVTAYFRSISQKVSNLPANLVDGKIIGHFGSDKLSCSIIREKPLKKAEYQKEATVAQLGWNAANVEAVTKQFNQLKVSFAGSYQQYKSLYYKYNQYEMELNDDDDSKENQPYQKSALIYLRVANTVESLMKLFQSYLIIAADAVLDLSKVTHDTVTTKDKEKLD